MSHLSFQGRISARRNDRGEQKVETERIDRRSELANGPILTLLKNAKAGGRGTLRDSCFKYALIFHDSPHISVAPLAHKPVLPRTPAKLQAGSRNERELLCFLKDSWRGRRDSNPRPPG
jgi:hypothetical protein